MALAIYIYVYIYIFVCDGLCGTARECRVLTHSVCVCVWNVVCSCEFLWKNIFLCVVV